jgi:uncharacterized protein
MIHPHTKVLNFGEKDESGVFATQFIPKGTLITVPSEVDQILSLEEVAAMPLSERTFLSEYAYLNNQGEYVLHHDNARYMNHSCEPNTLTVVDIDICIAVRDILANEEITEDYGLYYAEIAFDCFCGSKTCRKKVRQEDIKEYGQEWDNKIASVFHLIPKVEQPLWEIAAPSLKVKIEQMLAEQMPLPSCQVLNCSPEHLQKACQLLWPA